jgi:endo-1,4-beta-xylanase
MKSIKSTHLAATLLVSTVLLIPLSAQLANGRPKFLGNIIGNHVPGSYDAYWNQVTPGNSGKWGSVEGTRNVMNWATLDLAYNHALAKGYVFKEHTLVWGAQEPAWIASLPAAEQAAEVEQWFAALAARYPGLDQIDVVNEPLLHERDRRQRCDRLGLGHLVIPESPAIFSQCRIVAQ